MINPYLRPLLLAALAAAPLLAGADEVSDQIGLGAKAYQSGGLHQAVEELQGAIALIRQQLDTRYAALLPEPSEGWTADQVQSRSAGTATTDAGTQVSRLYHQQHGKGSVEIQLAIDSPLLATLSAELDNPMTLSSQTDTQPYVLGGERGLIRHPAKSRDWEIQLVLAERILVRVRGSDLSSREPVESYLQGLDLDAIQQAFGL